MSKKGHIPLRMCIGCRKKRKKEDMVRLVRNSDGVLLTGEKKNLNGRGYYLCPCPMCLKLAQKKNKWLESLESMDHSSPSAHVCLNGWKSQ